MMMGRKRLTKEEFIEKARAIHGDKYSYFLIDHIDGSISKVDIVCNKCRIIFSQRINHHLSGKGCPECAKKKRAKALTMTEEEFIAKAMEKHSSKYDYSLVEIKGNNKTKIKIKCNTCGCVFEQRIGDHLHGQGCPECAKERMAKAVSKALTMTEEEFIAKAMEKHSSKYDYSLVEIKGNNHTKVKIKCNTCGHIFEQRINDHLNGHGCSKCRQSHLEAKTELALKQNNIVFELQKTFPWLRDKREMPLDFYLPEYNIAIECQGEQHYIEEGRGYFTKETLLGIKQRDTLKYNLCKEHNIPIYYIRYDKDAKESVNKLVNSLINNSKEIII